MEEPVKYTERTSKTYVPPTRTMSEGEVIVRALYRIEAVMERIADALEKRATPAPEPEPEQPSPAPKYFGAE